MKTLELLQTLKNLQTKSYQQGYLNGIFASQRLHPYITAYKREDENIFFSSAIAFTLQEYFEELTTTEQKIALKIINKTVGCYPKFKNFQGENTYNFFKTNPMDFFPNGYVMRRFKFFKLADDADDTSYVYLTDSSQTSSDELKNKLIKHANGTIKWNCFLPHSYKKLKAYSVYFGKHMNIEIDVCVLCNILLWQYKNQLDITKQDIDSVLFIKESIVSKDYIHQPYLIAPCYPTTAQICYHVTRLLKEFNCHKMLSDLKPILINDIQDLLQQETLFINQLLYQISLLNLGVTPTILFNYQINDLTNKIRFFYTSIPLMSHKLWLRKLQKYTIFKLVSLQTTCKGYLLSLLLEYEILQKKNYTK